MYSFVKGFGVMPDLKSVELGAQIMESGGKFGFVKEKMGEMDWFEKINEDFFESLYEYTKEEVWKNLAVTLAKRDTKREFENLKKSLESANTDEFMDKMGEKMKIYSKEFENNSVQNLELKISN